jgi:hypothetical protein
LKTVAVIPTDVQKPNLILEEIFPTLRNVKPSELLETYQVFVEVISFVFRAMLIIENVLRNLEMTKNGFITGSVS